MRLLDLILLSEGGEGSFPLVLLADGGEANVPGPPYWGWCGYLLYLVPLSESGEAILPGYPYRGWWGYCNWSTLPRVVSIHGKNPCRRCEPHFSVSWPRTEISVYRNKWLILGAYVQESLLISSLNYGPTATRQVFWPLRCFGCFKVVWPLGAWLPGSRAFSVNGFQINLPKRPWDLIFQIFPVLNFSRENI